MALHKNKFGHAAKFWYFPQDSFNVVGLIARRNDTETEEVSLKLYLSRASSGRAITIYPCNFCTAVIYYGKKPRRRPVSLVVDEIEAGIERHRVHDYFIWADTFTIGLFLCRHDICGALKKLKSRRGAPPLLLLPAFVFVFIVWAVPETHRI